MNAVLGMLSEKDAWAARLARFEALPAVDLLVGLIERTGSGGKLG